MIESIFNEMIAEKPKKNDVCLIINIELDDGKTISCYDVESYQCTFTGHTTDSEDSEWIAIKSVSLNEVNVIKKKDIRRVHIYFSNRRHYTYE